MTLKAGHRGNISEYALLLVLVGGVSIYGLQTLGPNLSGNFKQVDNVGTLSLLAPLNQKGSASSAAEGGGQPTNNINTPMSPPSVLSDPLPVVGTEGQPTTVVAGSRGNRRGVNPPTQTTPDQTPPDQTTPSEPNDTTENKAPLVTTADMK
jgi:hypothetical protein